MIHETVLERLMPDMQIPSTRRGGSRGEPMLVKSGTGYSRRMPDTIIT